MSLRIRLLAAILLALVISLSLGAALAAWHAARTVHDELTASLANARRSTLATLSNLPPRDAGAAELQRIVSAFNGSRHIRVSLLSPGNGITAASEPAPGPPPPSWFLHMVAPRPLSVTAPVEGVPGIAAVLLQADPVSEAGERWVDVRDGTISFAVFFLIAASLCSLTVARSLSPLTSLAHALGRVARGETQAEIPELGPPEIATVAHAFNGMSAALRAAEAQNRRLAQQVLTIAEEERADIARDLHDEIGPLLFAITTFAAAIGRQVQTGDLDSVPAQLEAIQESTGRLQREVRDMLARLNGGMAAPADLAAALDDLLIFWRSLRPDIDFRHAISGDPSILSEAARDCLFHAAQEGISNAVRHGKPRQVAVQLELRPERVVLCVQDDGAGQAQQGSGFGLPGMRTRAASLGGTVKVASSPGWTLTVELPMRALQPVHA